MPACQLLLFKTALLQRNFARIVGAFSRAGKALYLAIILAVLIDAAAAHGQIDIGLPMAGPWNPGGPLVTLGMIVLGGPPRPYNFYSGSDITTVDGIPGDIVLLNGTSDESSSNWLGVVRYFNPNDPTGSQGLPATEMESIFPDDLGPDGFSNFKLLPDVYFNDQFGYGPSVTDEYPTVPGAIVEYTTVEFGPVGGVLSGQEAIVINVVADSPIPEPASTSLLALSGVALLRRTRREPAITSTNQR